MDLGKRLLGRIVTWGGPGLLLAGCVVSEPAAVYPAYPYDGYYGGTAPPFYPYGPGYYGPSLGFGFGGTFGDHGRYWRPDGDRHHRHGHERHPAPPPGHAGPSPAKPAGPAAGEHGGHGGQHPGGRAQGHGRHGDRRN